MQRKAHPSFYFKEGSALVAYLATASPADVASTLYTHQIGRVFTAIAGVEDTLSQAMLICENVEIDGTRRALPDLAGYERRKDLLKDQTFGNLIRILRLNGLSDEGVSYLKFLKRFRDKFIHRFFEDNPWPGEMDADFLTTVSRTLAAYEHIFTRANSRIWRVLGREIFHEFVDLGDAGYLIMNDIGAALDADHQAASMGETADYEGP